MKHKINDKLIELRKNARLTQQQLADALHVSAAAVSKWETGVSVPDLDMLCALADFFQISMDTLLCYTPRQSRAILFLCDQKGEEQARRILSQKGILVCGVAYTLSELTLLLSGGASGETDAVGSKADYLITILLSDPSDYLSAKLEELTAAHSMRRLTVHTTSEDQIGCLLGMMIDSFV